MNANNDEKTIDHVRVHALSEKGSGTTPFSEARSMKRELLAELRASWEAGQPVSPEDLLQRWPGVAKQDADAASLLLEDYLQRTRRCETPPRAQYDERFPDQKESLASLFIQHDVLRSLGAAPTADSSLRLPDLGDSLFGFTLRRELGRGSFARVFLADQADLADRPVVVKVSAIEGREPQTLAQLQHTHIVPIYSVHEDPRSGLRALCMPYFGGASLSQVLDALWKKTACPTRGEELIHILDAVGTPPPALAFRERQDATITPAFGLTDTRHPTPDTRLLTPDTRDLLSRLSYVQLAAWLVARLAEGLQHAHQRGVLHRDIKPSNILLGADGQPMLLDFNLSQSATVEQTHAGLGGTVAYMAPEHLRALAGRDPTLAHTVDQRSDIYSLGMVLFEILAGRRPFDQSASYAPLPVLIEAMALERGRTIPSLRAVRADVPWSLESILRRCLAPDPERRYRHADQLAEDLRRFLDDQPLRFAPELSRVERVQKWLRRHPRLASLGPVCAVSLLLLVGTGLTLAAVNSSLIETKSHLGAVQAQDRKRAFEKGAAQALFLVNTTNELEDHLRQGRTVCEETLGIYGVLDHSNWEEHPDWLRLTEDERLRLAEDVRELLLLLAGARVQLAPHDPATITAALELLDKAEAINGLPACRALLEDRGAYCTELRDEAGARRAYAQAATIEPRTARDFYLLAMTCSRSRKYTEAIVHLNDALRLNPRHYWSWIQRGLCHQETNDPVLAAADFGTCVGLEPDFAWGYFNRAYALARCGKNAEALADYTSALRCDPELLPAYVNRGLLRLEAGDAAAALADFQQALARGRDDAALHSGRGVALERLGRHREADAAFETAWIRSADSSPALRNRLRWVYGFAVANRLPDKALSAFEAVLDQEPQHPQALYGCAILFDKQGHSTEALAYYTKALEAAPDFTDARRFRAILYARLRRFREAAEEIQKCLEREPSSGSTRYAAACISALTSRLDARAAPRALEFLRQAFDLGYGRDKAANDPDLDALRDEPEFHRLVPGTAARSEQF